MSLSTQWREALALVVLVAPLIATVATWRWPRYSLPLGSLAALAATVLLAASATGHPVRFSLGLPFYLDDLSVYFLLIVTTSAVFTSWYAGRRELAASELDPHVRPQRFTFVFGVFLVVLVLVPVIDNLFIVWVLIELSTIASAVLLLWGSAQHRAEAAWKYFYITVPALLVTFLGLALVASTLPAGIPFDWSALQQVTPQLDPRLVSFAFICVLLGYGAKAGLAPLHTWLPDVHGEAPTPVSAMLSAVLLKIALFGILRWTAITNETLGSTRFTSSFFLAFGVVSIAVATLAILTRNRFKRVLAYHSLEHMGIIAFGLGIGTPLAVFGALLHAFNHALTKALMFLTYGHVRARYQVAQRAAQARADGQETTSGRDVEWAKGEDADEQIRGVFKMLPGSGALLALGGLALVGSPPFNIFLSEVLILWAAAQRAIGGGLVLVAALVVVVVSLVLIFAGLTTHLSRLLLDVPPFAPQPAEWRAIWPLFVLLGLIIAFGLALPLGSMLGIAALLHNSGCIILAGGGSCP